MLILDEVLQRWLQEPGLRERTVRWTWFGGAAQRALEAAAARRALVLEVDEQALCQAFFGWAESVESYARHEVLEPLDFRHFMAGLLLQKLLDAQNAMGGRALVRCDAATGANAVGSATAPANAQELPASLLTSFVLTLLQALRLQAGAPPFKLAPEFSGGMQWSSFLENAAQDPATAICFLDRMTGLEPVWQSPTLIESRPAMQRARALQATVS